ncbi:Eukaryotic translation initiation factor 1b [Tupaia chinensis]|uniref:Eukaryotic translation initiation factor 1b n=1 Tax=Tupaia chinensis TaxID=246437 RepID=L9KA97_TUPCH|nr:Eukaryotic translation initiation factor 1b [Tupaia chinensis]
MTVLVPSNSFAQLTFTLSLAPVLFCVGPQRGTGRAASDPFADATKGDDLLPAGTEDYIHIRIQQRNGRKTLTTVQGIADDYDKKKLVKAFKKKFACNGTVIEHPEYGEVIQLQGDQRKNICQFLLEVGIVKEEQLKVHGF